MALSGAACVTLARLKSILGVSGSTYDTELEGYIETYSAAIASYCHRTLEYDGAIEEMHAVGGSDRIVLARPPVAELTSVSYDGLVLDEESYELEDEEAGIVRLTGGGICDDLIGWQYQPQRVPGTARKRLEVVYAGGYAMPASATPTLPAPITQACVIACTAAWRARGRDPTIMSRSLGKWSESYGTTLQLGDADATGLPPSVLPLLRPYRRHMVTR